MIYKENRDDWRQAEIVVTTVQSLLFNNKYQRLFSPTDFDLVISDEAHRSIGGNARAVFDYFIGYKLGLTATPKTTSNSSTAAILRQRPARAGAAPLLDTYRTFGCENGQPTFRYSLLDGVKEGFLINPTVVDARTEITTALLSERGLCGQFTDDEGEDQTGGLQAARLREAVLLRGDQPLFCKTFLENALRDPISGEIGKSIVFAVSQNHAAKLTQIFNEMADRMFPGKYQSDFAVQVTSQLPDAQQFTINFANNNLLGSANFVPGYKTSKAALRDRGHDDHRLRLHRLLNLGLFRPIFSPTDFIQIKGRGTRKHNFLEQLFDDEPQSGRDTAAEDRFKLFDFFANCEYFEEDFNYDEVLKLPRRPSAGGWRRSIRCGRSATTSTWARTPRSIKEETVGVRGHENRPHVLRAVRGYGARGRSHRAAVEAGQWDRVIDYVNRECSTSRRITTPWTSCAGRPRWIAA